MYRCARCKQVIWGKINKHACFVESAAKAIEGFITVADAAKIANVDPITVYYAIRSRRLKRYELRGVYYVSRVELESWMRLRPVAEVPISEGETPEEMLSSLDIEPEALQIDDGGDAGVDQNWVAPDTSTDTSTVCDSSTDSSNTCEDSA